MLKKFFIVGAIACSVFCENISGMIASESVALEEDLFFYHQLAKIGDKKTFKKKVNRLSNVDFYKAVTKKDFANKTPIHYLMEHKHVELLRWLKKRIRNMAFKEYSDSLCGERNLVVNIFRMQQKEDEVRWDEIQNSFWDIIFDNRAGKSLAYQLLKKYFDSGCKNESKVCHAIFKLNSMGYNDDPTIMPALMSAAASYKNWDTVKLLLNNTTSNECKWRTIFYAIIETQEDILKSLAEHYPTTYGNFLRKNVFRNCKSIEDLRKNIFRLLCEDDMRKPEYRIAKSQASKIFRTEQIIHMLSRLDAWVSFLIEFSSDALGTFQKQ